MVQAPLHRIDFLELQTVVRAEFDTSAAVDADIDVAVMVLADRIDRAGGRALAAADALPGADHNSSAPALAERPRRAWCCAGSGVAAQAHLGHEPGGEPAGRVNTDPGV